MHYHAEAANLIRKAPAQAAKSQAFETLCPGVFVANVFFSISEMYFIAALPQSTILPTGINLKSTI